MTDNNNCSSVVCEIGASSASACHRCYSVYYSGLHEPEIELSNSIDKTKLTGKKILCGPFSLLDGFLKRPLDGFMNHMRWTPPFSSPSSSREGCSGH